MALNSSTVSAEQDIMIADHNNIRLDIQQHTHEGADTDFVGKIAIKTVHAGETINGATLPVPVYQDSADGELYACDANVATKLAFIGFAISNSTNGNDINFQTDGIVSGFSGLTPGADYYVQDTVGTIGTASGTYGILVGKAISATQIMILKKNWQLIGTDSISGSNAAGVATDTSSIPVGTKSILYEVSAYNKESTTYSKQTVGQILLILGIINSGYAQSSFAPTAASAVSIYGVKASISASVLTCETINIAGGGGATAYIAGTVSYFN